MENDDKQNKTQWEGQFCVSQLLFTPELFYLYRRLIFAPSEFFGQMLGFVCYWDTQHFQKLSDRILILQSNP